MLEQKGCFSRASVYVKSFSVVHQWLGVTGTLMHAGPRLPISTELGAVLLAVGTVVLLVIGYDAYRNVVGD